MRLARKHAHEALGDATSGGVRSQDQQTLFTVMNMSRRTGTSARALALTKATEAVARREAHRIEREKRLQATLAELFHAQAEAERIRTAAERAAAPFEEAVRRSVIAIEALGETRSGIASLTGLPFSRIRDYLTRPGLGEKCPADQDTSLAQAAPSTA